MMVNAPGPLSPAQVEVLNAGQERAGSFLSASRVAAFNGWTIGFFAVVSILFGLTSPTGLLIGAGLAVIARNEFAGRRRLNAFDVSGLELLWRNQIGFMALIVVYCLWAIFGPSADLDPAVAQLLEELGEDTGALVESLKMIVYSAVIVGTVIFQGLNARYYFVRVALMRAYLRDTPQWVLDVQGAPQPVR
jgi:hypothetical protein